MTPGISNGIPDEPNFKKQIERQIGCMTGFLQLFDRQQRFYSAKRLPISSNPGSPSPSERSDVSMNSLEKAARPSPSSSSPENCFSARSTQPLPLPVIEVQRGTATSWKLREAPRLSLDSRAVVDAKGKLRPRDIRTTPAVLPGEQSDCSETGEEQERQRRSPSVVARLMGLEALPVAGNEDHSKRCELRRSASESRVSRDLSHLAFDKPYPISSDELLSPRGYKLASVRPPADSPQGKSFFDPKDFFPEPKHTGSIYNEIEKRLRMRGVEEPAKDLETLKQILEALHFKGLLRTKPADFNPNYDHQPRIVNVDDSPIVVIKAAPKSTSQRVASQHLQMHRRSVSPRRPKPAERIPSAMLRRNSRPSVPSESSRSPNRSPISRRALHVEGHGPSQHHRSIPTAHSPRARSDSVASISPRIARQNTESSSKQLASSVMECDAVILSSSSKFDFERARILERCDKLLQSIAAITSSAEQVNVADQQPSPVSVLDSSFLAEESSASPLPKRSIGFKDQLVDWEEHKETLISGSDSKNGTEDAGVCQDDDYAYVGNIVYELGLRHPSEDVFSVLESGRDIVGSTKASKLHRRVIFDTVTEIIDRKRNVTPCGAFNSARSPWLARRGTSLPEEVWEQLSSLRERQIASEDVIDSNGKVIWREMTAAVATGEQEWPVPEAEMSEAVVHIERQLFKDLVGDTIRELAVLACRPRLPRRKLVF